MELSINTARSKGQGQTSFPAKYIQLHVLIVLHAVHVMFTYYARVVHQNRFKPVLTGSNRFKLVQTGSDRFKPGKTQEKVHRQQ